MSFNIAARSLLKTVPQTKPIGEKVSKDQVLQKLDAAGFSLEDTFRELRELYDNTEEDSVKRGILTDLMKVRGLLTTEQAAREIPSIVIQIQGDNTKVNAMLCPPVTSSECGNDYTNGTT